MDRIDLSEVYAGRIYRLPATEASRAAADAVYAEITAAIGTDIDPRDAIARDGLERIWRRCVPVIQSVRAGAGWQARVTALVRERGLDPETLRWDTPNLRLIPSGDLPETAAQNILIAHRDTWSAQPQAQVNWWLALHDTPAEATFAFYPDLFDHPVPNTSDEVDYARMRFASVATNATASPRCTADLEDARVQRFALKAGESLVFSAAHLHGTVPNTSGRTRFSIDFRLVPDPDRVDGATGAPNVDNRSTGSTWIDLRPLASAVP